MITCTSRVHFLCALLLGCDQAGAECCGVEADVYGPCIASGTTGWTIGSNC